MSNIAVDLIAAGERQPKTNIGSAAKTGQKTAFDAILTSTKTETIKGNTSAAQESETTAADGEQTQKGKAVGKAAPSQLQKVAALQTPVTTGQAGSMAVPETPVGAGGQADTINPLADALTKKNLEQPKSKAGLNNPVNKVWGDPATADTAEPIGHDRTTERITPQASETPKGKTELARAATMTLPDKAATSKEKPTGATDAPNPSTLQGQVAQTRPQTNTTSHVSHAPTDVKPVEKGKADPALIDDSQSGSASAAENTKITRPKATPLAQASTDQSTSSAAFTGQKSQSQLSGGGAEPNSETSPKPTDSPQTVSVKSGDRTSAVGGFENTGNDAQPTDLTANDAPSSKSSPAQVADASIKQNPTLKGVGNYKPPKPPESPSVHASIANGRAIDAVQTVEESGLDDGHTPTNAESFAKASGTLARETQPRDAKLEGTHLGSKPSATQETGTPQTTTDRLKADGEQTPGRATLDAMTAAPKNRQSGQSPLPHPYTSQIRPAETKTADQDNPIQNQLKHTEKSQPDSAALASPFAVSKPVPKGQAANQKTASQAHGTKTESISASKKAESSAKPTPTDTVISTLTPADRSEITPKPIEPAPTPQSAPILARGDATASPTPLTPILSPNGMTAGPTGALPAAETPPSMVKPGHPEAARDIGFQMAKQIANGVHKFSIRLDPIELGQIDIKMEVSADGQVKATLSTERPETLELLRADARGLERALADSGLKTSTGSVDFALKDQNQPGQDKDRQSDQRTQSHAEYRLSDDYETLDTGTGGLGSQQWEDVYGLKVSTARGVNLHI